MCALIFSTILSETFPIPRGGRNVIKMYIFLHVKYLLFLSDFKENLIFSTDFRKTLKYKCLCRCTVHSVVYLINPPTIQHI